jgi:hypothetical protein
VRPGHPGIDEYRLQATDRKGRAMHLDLSDDQANLLRELVDEAYRDLRYEIADTDNSQFKEQLRKRESEVIVLLDLLGGPIDRT